MSQLRPTDSTIGTWSLDVAQLDPRALGVSTISILRMRVQMANDYAADARKTKRPSKMRVSRFMAASDNIESAVRYASKYVPSIEVRLTFTPDP